MGRTYLAAIDHNAHLFRKAAVTKDGKPKYNKVYSKRSSKTGGLMRLKNQKAMITGPHLQPEYCKRKSVTR